MENTKKITMQFHPRAFAAFGADLVTNDAVAVTELVKNCYNAFAYNVSVIFGQDARVYPSDIAETMLFLIHISCLLYFKILQNNYIVY